MKVLILSLMISLLIGCAESSFELATDSRLPKWFEVPDGKTRSNYKVTMDYYVKPSGREAVFKIFDENGKMLKKLNGSIMGERPIEVKDPQGSFPKGYPSYEVITVDGITDIVEHRKREPIFYMSDNPQVMKEVDGKS